MNPNIASPSPFSHMLPTTAPKFLSHLPSHSDEGQYERNYSQNNLSELMASKAKLLFPESQVNPIATTHEESISKAIDNFVEHLEYPYITQDLYSTINKMRILAVDQERKIQVSINNQNHYSNEDAYDVSSLARFSFPQKYEIEHIQPQTQHPTYFTPEKLSFQPTPPQEFSGTKANILKEKSIIPPSQILKIPRLDNLSVKQQSQQQHHQSKSSSSSRIKQNISKPKTIQGNQSHSNKSQIKYPRLLQQKENIQEDFEQKIIYADENMDFKQNKISENVKNIKQASINKMQDQHESLFLREDQESMKQPDSITRMTSLSSVQQQLRFDSDQDQFQQIKSNSNVHPVNEAKIEEEVETDLFQGTKIDNQENGVNSSDFINYFDKPLFGYPFNFPQEHMDFSFESTNLYFHSSP